VNAAAVGGYTFSGQACVSVQRVYVEEPIAAEFTALLAAAVEKLPVGDTKDPATVVGPVISEQARDAIRRTLEASNAERVYEGSIPDTADFANGWFLPPTVLRGAATDSELAQRELFGPVLAMFPADDLDHAVALANDTPYGLSASLFTRDVRSALRYIRGIKAGLVRVNGDTTGVDPHAPFGGMKGSSSGTREQGGAAREFYTEIKTVQINP